MPLRKHLEKVWQATGKKPARLIAVEQTELPLELAYLYQWFGEFYNGEPFSYLELEAWSRMTGRQLDWNEVDIMRRLALARERGIS